MTTAVCELGRAGGYGRLVQYSSSEIYGTALSAPMDEDHPLRPHTPYAAAKAATDLVAESYATTFGLETVCVRPFNTYGERQNDAAYAGLIPMVVRARRGRRAGRRPRRRRADARHDLRGETPWPGRWPRRPPTRPSARRSTSATEPRRP